ncbi:MAG: signal peptide peptidase SppA [bacterium]
MIKNWFYKLLRFSGILLIIFLLFIFALQSMVFIHNFWPEALSMPGSMGRDKIGVLKMEGPIFSVDKQLEQLRNYKRRKDIKAILLDIDSPGGAVAPTQELNEGIEQIKEKGKPIIASIRSVGASGGYYLASSADTIVATPGSMVGSIGVQIQIMRFDELIDKVGIDYEVIKSGKYKDIGSPFREISEEERKILKNMIMDVYDQFIEHIVRNRDMGRAEVEEIANGSIFTGRQALRIGLVDKTGTKSKALEVAGKAAGISGDPATVEPTSTPSPFFSEQTSELLGSINEVFSRDERSVRLLYIMSNWSLGND